MPKNVSGVCRYCPSSFFDKTAQLTPGTVLIGLCTELFANSLRLPYDGDRLGFTFSKDNFHNDFTVTDNIGFKCFFGTIEPLKVVIIRNADVTMLTSAGDYESRSRLP